MMKICRAMFNAGDVSVTSYEVVVDLVYYSASIVVDLVL